MSNKRQNSWNITDDIHKDLLEAKNRLYNPIALECSLLTKEKENTEYSAYSFELDDLSIKYRVAKMTPIKVGQFVTLWKRVDDGPTLPYDISDSIDFFVVSTRKGKYFGQFIFPKSVLRDQAVLSVNKEGGKRAIRVYPPWDMALNRQAQKTQKWQIAYFLDMSQDKEIDFSRARMLYSRRT
jgi:hypothetical protein